MNKSEKFDLKLRDIARFARAISHPARLAILQYLADTKTCISGDISDNVPLSRTTVSQHLKELRDMGLIHGDIDGLKINYCICQPTIEKYRQMFDAFFIPMTLNPITCAKFTTVKILILCTGNSCRSQMAHGFLQSFDKRLTVCSAGTEPAEHINQKAVKVMSEAGIDISHHTPKQVNGYLSEEWDYVITVCDHANETCPLFLGKVKTRLHMGFDDPSKATGTDKFILSEFRRVRDEIKEGFWKLYLERLKNEMI